MPETSCTALADDGGYVGDKADEGSRAPALLQPHVAYIDATLFAIVMALLLDAHFRQRTFSTLTLLTLARPCFQLRHTYGGGPQHHRSTETLSKTRNRGF